MIRELPRAHKSCPLMKPSTQKARPGAPNPKPNPKEGDDVWAWIVIGLIFGGVTLALYGPLIWQAAHPAL